MRRSSDASDGRYNRRPGDAEDSALTAGEVGDGHAGPGRAPQSVDVALVGQFLLIVVGAHQLLPVPLGDDGPGDQQADDDGEEGGDADRPGLDPRGQGVHGEGVAGRGRGPENCVETRSRSRPPE